MARVLYAAIVSCAAVAICSGVAMAAQTPEGNLGHPTSVSTGTITSPLLVQSTASCPGFAIGDTLTFPTIETRFMQRFWSDTPLGISATAEVDPNLTGSVTAGDWTYSLRGHFNSGISFAEDFFTSGKATITRGDGVTISGAANLLANPPVFQGVLLVWAETPRCK